MALINNKIKRLLRYKLCLHQFKELGFENIYSYSIGSASGVSAIQVRKDFAEFGITGNKRGGYNIDYLNNSLNTIFGNQIKNIIIIGMGNIGRALAQYAPRLTNENLNIVAGFDIDPSKHKKAYGMPVFSLKMIPEIISVYNVKAAIIAIPAHMAQNICNILIEEGIKGILNFSPIVLRVPDNVIVNNINLTNELESIVYSIEE